MADSDLISRAAGAATQAAFQALVERHRSMVYSRRLSVSRANHYDAEDIAQEVFHQGSIARWTSSGRTRSCQLVDSTGL
jgi:DNA-directed RNA polymerase specialized sigma24 family protein